MIKSLEIKNYALIDKLSIELDAGFTIITGETGAGKSIILGALSLLMGQRADISVVRNKDNKCVVEAIFDITNYNLKSFFEQNDVDYFENTIIRREISSDGRSRAFINDVPVNLTTLRNISEKIIDIHSQHDTLDLNSAAFQTEAIDSFAKNQKNVEQFQYLYKAYKKALNEFEQLNTKAQQEKADYDYYQYQYEQIEKAKLKAGEQEELEAEQRQLSHVEEIKMNLSKVYNSIDNENISVLGILKEALKAAENIEDFLPQAHEFYERINSAIIDLKDLSNETEKIDSQMIFEPQRLEYLNNRLDLIYSLENKFNASELKDLLELKSNFEQRLLQINTYDEVLKQKQIEIENIKNELNNYCNQLHQKRIKAKSEFEKQVIDITSNLGMKVDFEVEIEQTYDFSIYGKDKITFLFTANKNTELQSIAKIASGGELSRLMLAIKYIVSQSKALPTIVFDEIDTGISGEIAYKMAILLKQMSENMQIMNITHLPQIAAKANVHFVVYKENSDESTQSQIKKLDSKEQIIEIAKMLSGNNISDSAIEHAKELINN